MQFYLLEHLLDGVDNLAETANGAAPDFSKLVHPVQFRAAIRLMERAEGRPLVRNTEFVPWAGKRHTSVVPPTLAYGRYSFYLHKEVAPHLKLAAKIWGLSWSETITECLEDEVIGPFELRRKLRFWKSQFATLSYKRSILLMPSIIELSNIPTTYAQAQKQIPYKPWRKNVPKQQ